MRKAEIKVGGHYLAKVSGKVVTVRVDSIKMDGFGKRLVTTYQVTNLATGRKTTFRSAAKFRGEMSQKVCPQCKQPVPTDEVYPFGMHRECYLRSNAVKLQPKHTITGLSVGPLGGLTTEPTPKLSCAICGAEAYPTPTGWQCSASSNHKEGEQCSDPTRVLTEGPTDATVATASVGGKLGGNSIAARIAAARAKREPGTAVAGMIPNAEQEAILAAATEQGLRALVVGAGAGTGKTATLKMLEQVLPGKGQYTAFNSSLVAEGKAKFVKAACNTTHSLAFRAVGKLYQHRLGGERMRSQQVARILGIEPFSVVLKGQGTPDDDGKATDKVKILQGDFLAGQVLTAVRRFCQSSDREIQAQHLRHIDGIDAPVSEPGPTCFHCDTTRKGYDNNDRVRDYLLSFCKKAWADLSQVNGQLPFSHDVYVKLWQLGEGNDRPIIAADYILLDEAQDTAPVFLDVLRQQQHALLVFVGDSNQAIYEWRGAVDAMKAYPDATRRLLTQSYRFGQAVADVANAVLTTLDDPTDLVMRGNPTVASRVEEVAEPRCYLYRTNAGALGRIMSSITEWKKPHLIGGKNYVADMIAWCQAAMDLQAKRGTRHPELCCFESWGEVVEYSKTDEGSDMRLMVKLIEEFGAESIRDALRDMPKEEDADLVVSTAHKSKGREWDTIKLGADFPTANKMTDADRRLLYVAATRAKLTLDITECPPFCGGEDKWSNGGSGVRWVPGINITYTQSISVKEDVPVVVEAPKLVPLAPPKQVEKETPVTATIATCTYTKLRNGDWGLRSTTPIKEGDTVTVTTKAGQRKVEVVGRVLWSGNGVWLATKGGNGNAGRQHSSQSSSRGQRTGCSCGSIEGEYHDWYCSSCRHDELDM